MPNTMHTFPMGDDIDAICILRKNGAILPISLGAIVKAAIVHNETETVFGPVACVSNAIGADWENGIVVASFPSAITDTFATVLVDDRETRATLEIEVQDSGRQTWQQDSVMLKRTYIS